MASIDSSERPAKKPRLSDDNHGFLSGGSSPPSSEPQRFFSDPPPQAVRAAIEASLPPLPSSPPRQHLPTHHSPVRNGSDAPVRSESRLPRHESSSVAFEKEVFEAFVGHKVEAEIMDLIRDGCQGNLERAVNMYFDGTWKHLERPSRELASVTGSRSASPTSLAPPPGTKSEPSSSSSSSPSPKKMGEPRYIGAFGVEGWATKSGHHLLRHGDKIRIERQRLHIPQATKGPVKIGQTIVTQRMVNAAARRNDVLVRFTDQRGTEIGRLVKEAASWISSLIDQKICKFEGTCVYAPERLRTNDTIFIQLTAWLLPTAFELRGLQPDDDIKVGFKEQEETTQEKELRLRQIALVRLFQEINLFPSTLQTSAAKEQRQGLLQAAEQDEENARQPPRLPPPRSVFLRRRVRHSI
jgi:DNA repair protein RAD5